MKNGSRKFVQNWLSWRPNQLTSHAEMDNQMAAALELNQNEFSTPLDLTDALIDQSSLNFLWQIFMPLVWAQYLDSRNDLINDLLIQLTGDGFNFW